MRRYRWRDRRGGERLERTIVLFTVPGGPRRTLDRVYFDKSRAAKLRSRHPTLKFRRKAITNDHDRALSEEDL